MASIIIFILIFTLTFTPLPSPSHAQPTCTTQKFTNNNLYTHCTDLPHLNSYLHWSLNPNKNTLSVAFLAPPSTPSGWVSWAINPSADGMAGAQALLAYRASNGSMAVKTFNISSYSSVVEGELAFDVVDKRAEYEGGVIKVFATVVVGKGVRGVNQVWQVGPSVSPDGIPARHEFQPANLGAKGRLDLLSGESSGGGGGGGSVVKKRNIHGILNAVSWGVLFPVGIIIARYLRTFPSADPAWFYLHAFCQVSAYAIGVAGWGTGLKLGSDSKGVTYSTHRSIGIALFSLATVQVFALFLRPNKEHKIRFYWNIYHHGIGYAILVLSIINVFKGLDILAPETKWRTSYIIVISTLGAIALLLEVITWIIMLKRKSSKSTKPYDNKQQPLAP